MKVLVLGSSAREHAIVWKLLQAKQSLEVLAIPGNGGISEIVECIDADTRDVERILEIAIVRNVDLTIVGDSNLFSQGIVDKFEAAGKKIIGPTLEASKIFSSRHFCKELIFNNSIPAPNYASFNNFDLALAYISSLKGPFVIKADNPFSNIPNKIVLSKDQAENSEEQIIAYLQQAFKVNQGIIVEDLVDGNEISIVTICDGNLALTLIPTQSYRRFNDGDLGPFTDGMGAFAPTPIVSNEILHEIRNQIINPTIEIMKKLGTPYSGILTFDIIVDKNAKPKLIEYVGNFKEPDAQVILPLLDENFFEICLASANHDLSPYKGGFYKYDASALSINLNQNECDEESIIDFRFLNEPNINRQATNNIEEILQARSIIFHSETKKEGDYYINTGPKVLSATAIAENLVDAQILAYKVADSINFRGKYYRKDIGDKGMI